MNRPLPPATGAAGVRRSRLALSAGVLCAVLLSACAAPEEEEPEIKLPSEPTAISPDRVVTCAEAGDCGEAGSVRWSMPLDGDYYTVNKEDYAPRLFPEAEWLERAYPSPTALVHRGTVYYYEQDRFIAVDAESGERLWEVTVDPERPKTVEEVLASGDGLIVETWDLQAEEVLLYLVSPDDGGTWKRIDVGSAAPYIGLEGADEHHVLVRGPEARYLLIDTASGETVWSRKSPLDSPEASLTEDGVYLLETPGKGEKGPPRLIHLDLEDGRTVSGIDLPESVNDTDLYTVLDGTAVFVRPYAEEAPLQAADAETGKRLWEYPEAVSIVSTDPGDGLIYVREGQEYRAIDAGSGKIARYDASGQTAALIDQFGTRYREDPDMVDLATSPPYVYGPGVGDFDVEAGAVVQHLDSYIAEDGSAVGVYSGCAPGGLEPPRQDAPAGGWRCTSPRLFAVDYGV